MKKKIWFTIAVFLIPVFSILYAQGLQPPSQGKAVIYFTRISNLSFGVTFEYFQDDKYLGEFKGRNYMKFEFDPGEYLLWAHGENVDYMTSNLKAGDVYIVIVNVYFGKLGFTPVKITDKELFDQAMALINEQPPMVTPEKVFNTKKQKLTKLITERLKLYYEKYKIDPEKHFKHLSPDFAIPLDQVK
jgi:hypothetical protein